VVYGWMDGDRSKTLARGPMFRPNVLPLVKSEKSIKAEKNTNKERQKKTKRTLIEES
jgi:hypothetical protein